MAAKKSSKKTSTASKPRTKSSGASKSRSKSSSRRPDHRARFTTNHRVIKRWAEERGGTPATVKATRRKGDPAGILRIDFPGYSGEGTLKEIPWDDFFAKFDENDLAFLYQKQTKDGKTSRFCKFISVEEAEQSDAEPVKGKSKDDAKPRGRRSSITKAKTTQSHRVIKRWAEERGGTPATVKATRRKGDPAGILRIDFPGYSGEGTLKEIPWDDFFAKFDEANLLFLYQDQTKDGKTSRFCRFISADEDGG